MQTTDIVWTNGCFDVLHRGHIELFKYAKSLGKYLVVGIDEDERIKNSKGPERPINTLEDRKTILIPLDLSLLVLFDYMNMKMNI